jgi:hypothetical protein
MALKRFGLLVFPRSSTPGVNSKQCVRPGGTGIVVRTVTDPSGAAVPGATVILTDTATNAVRIATTNDAGQYNFPNVPPGNYNVTISKAGFRVGRILNQNVSVSESRTLDVKLEIGSATETVEVTATNTELQTMNATIGNTVDSSTLQALPSLGRDVSSFVTMQPGVSPDASVGGTVVDQANFMLDGGNNSNDMEGSGASTIRVLAMILLEACSRMSIIGSAGLSLA